jgi:putative ABC transport system ATP-binding protein
MNGSRETSAVLTLADVSRVHGHGATAVHALRGLDLTISQGELVAVMGPSGSGKSTLLNVAGGLDRATTGRVVVSGHELGAMSRGDLAVLRRRRVGYVFQDFNLIPTLTAIENVALPLELDGVRLKQARAQADHALDAVGLQGLDRRFPDELSGGQQQRVAIARAMVGERVLVLADEPTGALDSETGEQIMALLRARCDAGMAALLVTHEGRHAAWADRVVFLRDGAAIDDTGPRSRAEELLEGLA